MFTEYVRLGLHLNAIISTSIKGIYYARKYMNAIWSEGASSSHCRLTGAAHAKKMAEKHNKPCLSIQFDYCLSRIFNIRRSDGAIQKEKIIYSQYL